MHSDAVLKTLSHRLGIDPKRLQEVMSKTPPRAKHGAILEAQGDPILTQAWASFHTNDDDKDHDTLLEITLNNGTNELAAVNGIIGEFSDHSDMGPFALTVQGEWRKSDIRQPGTSSRLRIIPDGNDTWRFNFFLELVYADGTHQNWEWYNLQLKEDRNTIAVPL